MVTYIHGEDVQLLYVSLNFLKETIVSNANQTNQGPDFTGLKNAIATALLAASQPWKVPGLLDEVNVTDRVSPANVQGGDNPYVEAYKDIMVQNAEKFRHPFKTGSLEALRMQALQSKDLHERLTIMAKVIEKSDKILELADAVEELGKVLEEEISVVSRCQKAAAAHRKAEAAMLKGFEEQLS